MRAGPLAFPCGREGDRQRDHPERDKAEPETDRLEAWARDRIIGRLPGAGHAPDRPARRRGRRPLRPACRPGPRRPLRPWDPVQAIESGRILIAKSAGTCRSLKPLRIERLTTASSSSTRRRSDSTSLPWPTHQTLARGPKRYPMPPPLSLEELDAFLDRQGIGTPSTGNDRAGRPGPAPTGGSRRGLNAQLC